MQDKSVKKRHFKVDCGTIKRDWKYDPNYHIDSLLRMCQYIKYTNVEDFSEISNVNR